MNIKIEKVKSISDILNPKTTWWDDIYWAFWRTWHKAYWYFYYTFNPQHQSIRKAIPKSWSDLDGIVEDVLKAVIISFVEDEKGLDQIDMINESLKKDDEYLIKEWGSVDLFWEYYTTRYNDYLRLKQIYDWVKTGKSRMENYLKATEENNNWQEYSKVEHDIHDRDSEYLADLVRLRKYLWT